MPKRPQAADLATFAQRPPQAQPRGRTGRLPFNSYLTPEVADRLRVLAWTMSAQEHRRVTVAELVERAVVDLLEAEGA